MFNFSSVDNSYQSNRTDRTKYLTFQMNELQQNRYVCISKQHSNKCCCLMAIQIENPENQTKY